MEINSRSQNSSCVLRKRVGPFALLSLVSFAPSFGRGFRYTDKVKEPKGPADESRKRAAGSFAGSVASRRQASTVPLGAALCHLCSFLSSDPLHKAAHGGNVTSLRHRQLWRTSTRIVSARERHACRSHVRSVYLFAVMPHSHILTCECWMST